MQLPSQLSLISNKPTTGCQIIASHGPLVPDEDSAYRPSRWGLNDPVRDRLFMGAKPSSLNELIGCAIVGKLTITNRSGVRSDLPAPLPWSLVRRRSCPPCAPSPSPSISPHPCGSQEELMQLGGARLTMSERPDTSPQAPAWTVTRWATSPPPVPPSQKTELISACRRPAPLCRGSSSLERFCGLEGHLQYPSSWTRGQTIPLSMKIWQDR